MVRFMAYPASVKAEVIRLRIESRLSIRAIASKMNLSQGTVSLWLRGKPLSLEERAARATRAGRSRTGWKKPTPAPTVAGHFAALLAGKSFTRQQKGAIAETAVLLRLQLAQLEAFRPAADGARIDWIVVDPKTGRTSKVQVKWAKKEKHGLPVVPVCCHMGAKNSIRKAAVRRKYTDAEVDFLVGYDLYTDSCYVWSWAEVKAYATMISVSADALERWDKLLG